MSKTPSAPKTTRPNPNKQVRGQSRKNRRMSTKVARRLAAQGKTRWVIPRERRRFSRSRYVSDAH